MCGIAGKLNLAHNSAPVPEKDLRQMLAQIEMIGNDLDMRRRVTAPTLKISEITVAGN